MEKRLAAHQTWARFFASPETFFDAIAADYLYHHQDLDENSESTRARAEHWHVNFDTIDAVANPTFTAGALIAHLFPDIFPNGNAELTGETWPYWSEIRHSILRRLCWLGLLAEERETTDRPVAGTFEKTALWSACLRLTGEQSSAG